MVSRAKLFGEQSATEIPTDPHVIERFADTQCDEPDEATSAYAIENLDAFLDRIPPAEREAITLYYLHGKTLVHVAEILGITHPTVHYRLESGLAKLKVLASLPVLSLDDIANASSGVLSDTEARVAHAFWQTASCHGAARIAQVNARTAPYTLDSAVCKLVAHDKSRAYGVALAKLRDSRRNSK